MFEHTRIDASKGVKNEKCEISKVKTNLRKSKFQKESVAEKQKGFSPYYQKDIFPSFLIISF